MRGRWLTAFALLVLVACDDDGGSGDPDDAGLDAATDGATGTQDAEPAFNEDVPELREEVDRQSHFPVPEGGSWRYREKAEDWQNPPPLMDGAESTVMPGEGENEVIRETVMLVDGEIEGEPTRIRRVLTETLIVTPSMELVGPKVEVKGIRVEEREVGTDRFVRVLERTYLPPYTLIEDAWKVGIIFTEINDNMIRMTERLQLRGQEEPSEMSGLIELKVETTPVGEDGAVIPMECQYREGIRELRVFDDFSGLVSRTYWLQQGVGPVQMQFRDSSTFTLVETNLEGDPAPCPPE